MHIPLEEVVMDSRHEASERAVWMSQQVRKRADTVARTKISGLDYGPDAYADNLERLGIHTDAWTYISGQKIEPKLVFAHPKILMEYPQSSLHYRGIAMLPYKRVTKIASSVRNWERDDYTGSPRQDACERVAVLYNSIISTIILDSDDWTKENGYRNILATMGASNDGVWRNALGRKGEELVRDSIVKWLESEKIMPFEIVRDDQEYILGRDPDTVRMRFSSEPDISFERKSGSDWIVVSTIEIKSGTDPAGALERLGAIRKSFEETPAQSRNFLVLGTTTPTMRERLNEMNIARSFNMWDILDGHGQREFINEVFHYTLRLMDKPWKPHPR